jgi:hypothetical protein
LPSATVRSSSSPEPNGAPADHTLQVRALNQYRDSNGEQVMDLSPAEYTWHVQDVAPPDTQFLGATEIGPPQFLEPGLRFTFRGNDDWASSFELTFECAFDNTDDAVAPVWEECGEPGANDSFFHEIAYADLTAGPYTFQVRAVDVAENVDQTPDPVPGYEFVNEAEPETTITSVEPDITASGETTSREITFTFTSMRCTGWGDGTRRAWIFRSAFLVGQKIRRRVPQICKRGASTQLRAAQYGSIPVGISLCMTTRRMCCAISVWNWRI